jgi:hypothetical protein
MRFIYKREPVEDLQLELRKVSQVMSSGGLVLFDLLFYSLIFTLLIMPAASPILHLSGIYLLIYVSFSCIFLFVRRTAREISEYHEK